MKTNKVLKLAFAMGGGVSLGAFSGSALAETIKLALLKRIKEPESCGYSHVEIDVFSGASAGSMALAVMLRGLAWRQPEEERDAIKVLSEDTEIGAALLKRIRKNPAFEYEDGEKRKCSLHDDLVAVQVVMDLQKKAWVESISMDELLAVHRPERREQLRWEPGILDSEAVYRIARKLLIPKDGPVNVDKRRLLTKRCLFASTLTCLTPFVADARGTFHTSEGSAPGLRDALRSKMHKDMRIFDINFEKLDSAAITKSERTETLRHEASTLIEEKLQDKQSAPNSFQQSAEPQDDHPCFDSHFVDPHQSDEYDGILTAYLDTPDEAFGPTYMKRWYRLHAAPKESGFAGDIRSRSAWAQLSATAIACGAFPAAFAPAVLKRYKWEYGDDHWPKPLDADGRDRHHFAYVDGGVFNNDPIREAFRLASFMDARDQERLRLRRIIYVDPAVSPEHSKLTVPSLREFTEDKPGVFNLFSPRAAPPKAAFSRVFDLLGNLIGTFIDQGRSREADAQARTRNNFELRDRFRDAVCHLMHSVSCSDIQINMHQRLNIGCAYCLKRLQAELIPPGEGSLVGELRRVVGEMHGMIAVNIADAHSYLKHGIGGAKGVPLSQANCWLAAHLALYLDLMLGLEGKNEGTEIIAITPYTLGKDPKNPKPVKLLGDPISAFAGFMSEHARVHDFEMGIHCARVFLHLDQQVSEVTKESPERYALLPSSTVLTKLPKPPQGHQARRDFTNELEHGVNQLRERVEQMVSDGMGKFAGLVIGLVEFINNVSGQVREFAEAQVADFYHPGPPLARRVSVEIAITMPAQHKLELDAKGLRDRDAPAQRQRREIDADDSKKPGEGNPWKDVNVIFTQATYVRDLNDENDAKASGHWVGAAVRGGNHFILESPGLHLRSWGRVPLPESDQLERLLCHADLKLRPVLFLALTETETMLGPTSDLIHRWKCEEAAVPLYEVLLHQDLEE